MRTTLALLALTATLACNSARGDVVTITAEGDGTNFGQAEFLVGQYEVAELLSIPSGVGGRLSVVKDGRIVLIDTSPQVKVVVAGPATFRLVTPTATHAVLCTFRVTPEPYPPDRAIIVPPGTNQTQVVLESSTNLIHWFQATNGIYGPLPEAKFFRIRADRLH